MRDYNEDNNCPKCRYSAVSTKYERDRYRYPAGRDENFMARQCNRCGYSWRETPLDALTGTGKAT